MTKPTRQKRKFKLKSDIDKADREHYVVYKTLYSDGEIVVRLSDSSFPIGKNPLTGEVIYQRSMREVQAAPNFELILITDDVHTAATSDTAGCLRQTKDVEELDYYMSIVNADQTLVNFDDDESDYGISTTGFKMDI